MSAPMNITMSLSPQWVREQSRRLKSVEDVSDLVAWLDSIEDEIGYREENERKADVS